GQATLETVRHAMHHVRDQGAVGAAHGVRLARLVDGADLQGAILLGDGDERIEPLHERALGTLDRYLALAQLDLDAVRNGDRHASDSGHLELLRTRSR